MSDLQESLVPGETVLYRTGLHWTVLLGPSTLAVIAALAAAGLLVASFKVGADGVAPGSLRILAAVFLLIGVVVLVVGIVRRSSVQMAVTNRRVLIQSGIVARRTIELMLSKVESIAVEQGMAGRLAGYGRVVVRGTGGTHEVFERIAGPLEFRRQVQMQIQQVPLAPEPSPRGSV